MISIATILVLFVVACDSVDGYLRVCYVTNWSQYRNSPAKYFASDIPTGLCTHVIFAFAKVAQGGKYNIQPYEWNDISRNYPDLVNLKKRDPQVKTLLAIGGWTHASQGFNPMVENKEDRRNFITEAVAFLKLHGFDGLDLDWEYPGIEERGSKPGHKYDFTLLCKELKEEFSKHGLLLTAAVAAGQDKIEKAYEIKEISLYLDFINLMSYDLHGAWDKTAGHHTDSDETRKNKENGKYVYTVHNSMKMWLDSGMDPKKLILGLGTYGRTQNLRSSCYQWDLNSPTNGPGLPGRYTKAEGFLAYYEICNKKWQNKRCTKSSKVHGPYGTDGRDFIGYDDEESIIYKVNNIMKPNNLGGFMFWALDLDDFFGTCGNGKYPLINAAVNAALNRPQNAFKKCQDVTTSKCSTPVPPTPSPNNCRVNPNGPWAGDLSMDTWCKNAGNCPGNCGQTHPGCTTCMCECGGVVTKTTTKEPSTSTTTTTTTTSTTTKPPTTSTTTKEPTSSTMSSTTSTSTKPSTTSTTTTTTTTSTSTGSSTTSTVSPSGQCRTNPIGPWKDVNADRWCNRNCPSNACGKPGCSTCLCICETRPATTTMSTPKTSSTSTTTSTSTTSTSTTKMPNQKCAPKPEYENKKSIQKYCQQYCPSRCDVSWFIQKHCLC